MPRDLRPGDRLNLYIAQDQLTATVFAGEPETAVAQTVPISPAPEEGERVAAATSAPGTMLPTTASVLPLFGAAGLILVGLGAALSIVRSRRPST